VEEVKERLAGNKLRSQRFHIGRFNLKNMNYVEGKEQYFVEISNRFVALVDWDAEMNINSAHDIIKENNKISAKESLGYYVLKKHIHRSMKDVQND
jgi:hypothetical protein